jgi:hypothetical protein
VVASVRTAAYHRLPRSARFGSTPGAKYLRVETTRGDRIEHTPLVEIGPLGREELAEVYERYRAYRRPDPDDSAHAGIAVFRPTTTFADSIARLDRDAAENP